MSVNAEHKSDLAVSSSSRSLFFSAGLSSSGCAITEKVAFI